MGQSWKYVVVSRAVLFRSLPCSLVLMRCNAAVLLLLPVRH